MRRPEINDKNFKYYNEYQIRSSSLIQSKKLFCIVKYKTFIKDYEIKTN